MTKNTRFCCGIAFIGLFVAAHVADLDEAVDLPALSIGQMTYHWTSARLPAEPTKCRATHMSSTPSRRHNSE